MPYSKIPAFFGYKHLSNGKLTDEGIREAVNFWRRVPLNCFYAKHLWRLYFANNKRLELWLTNPEAIIPLEPTGATTTLQHTSKFPVDFTCRVPKAIQQDELMTFQDFTEGYRVFTFGEHGTIPCFASIGLDSAGDISITIGPSITTAAHERLERLLAVELERNGIDSTSMYLAGDFARASFTNGESDVKLPYALDRLPLNRPVPEEIALAVRTADASLRRLSSIVLANASPPNAAGLVGCQIKDKETTVRAVPRNANEKEKEQEAERLEVEKRLTEQTGVVFPPPHCLRGLTKAQRRDRLCVWFRRFYGLSDRQIDTLFKRVGSLFQDYLGYPTQHRKTVSSTRQGRLLVRKGFKDEVQNPNGLDGAVKPTEEQRRTVLILCPEK